MKHAAIPFAFEFRRRVLYPVVGLIIVAFAFAVGLLYQVSQAQDFRAREQSLRFAREAIETRTQNLRRTLKDYAAWGAAYDNLHKKLSIDWAYNQENIGATLYESFAVDYVLLFDARGRNVYSVVRGKNVPLPDADSLAGGLQELLAAARQAGPNETKVVTGVLDAGGEPVVVAAAALSTGGDPLVTAIDGPASILVFGDRLTAAKLSQLGASIFVGNMRAAHETAAASGEPSLALPTLDGTHALTLRWQPDQPGREMLAAVLPWLVVAALGLGIFVALVIRHAARAADTIAESATQLAHANAEISALNDKLTNENLRLGAELDVARRIQLMVLPKDAELQRIPMLDIASYIIPADEVAGDYYDVLQDGKKTKIGIGDVTGHGLESGVLMLMVQSVARALQESGENDPKQFLSVLNRAIYKNVERTASDKHLSLAFVDYEDQRLTLSGQHEEALIIRGDGTIERIDTMELGFPVGLEPDISAFVATRDFAFTGDDVMVLYTDGITEAESPAGELFGIDRLCQSAQKHYSETSEQIKDGIISDLMQHMGTQKPHDDITLVVLRHR